MLRTGIEKTPLFTEYAPLLEQLGVLLVDINRIDRGSTVNVSVIILAKEVDVNIDHCAKVYRLIYPRMQLTLGERDLQLEVSTPGLQRNLKDVYEFRLYSGKRVRVYTVNDQAWISGIIEGCSETQVTLTEVYIEDEKDMIRSKDVEFAQIQKAKLDYRWEDNSHGN